MREKGIINFKRFSFLGIFFGFSFSHRSQHFGGKGGKGKKENHRSVRENSSEMRSCCSNPIYEIGINVITTTFISRWTTTTTTTTTTNAWWMPACLPASMIRKRGMRPADLICSRRNHVQYKVCGKYMHIHIDSHICKDLMCTYAH